MSKTTSTPVPVAPGASVTMSAAQLTRALRILDPIRSSDSSRPMLNGFYLERGPDDEPVFVATDSYRLGAVTAKGDWEVEWSKDWKRGHGAVFDIPVKRLQSDLRATMRRKMDGLATLTVGDVGTAAFNPGAFTWNERGVILRGNLDEDVTPVFGARADSKGFPYVSWRSITSQERQETKDGTPVAFDPRYLSDMCKVVESLGWGAGQTPIRFVGGLSGMAEVRAEADNLAFHGLLMAVRIS